MEQIQQENTGAKPGKSRKSLIVVIVAVLAVALIVAGVFVGISANKDATYKEALSLLEDGDFEEAIAIHKRLGDYKNLQDAFADEADSHCKKLLKKGSYKKIVKLYTDLADYPDAIEEMNGRLGDHIRDLAEEFNAAVILEIREEFSELEALSDLLMFTVGDAAVDMWNDSEISCMSFYRELRDQGWIVNEITELITEQMISLLQNHYFDIAFNRYHYLADIPEYQERITSACEEEIERIIASGAYDTAITFYNWLTVSDIQTDAIGKAIYDCGVKLLEDGLYYDARQMFTSMVTNGDPYYSKDAHAMRALTIMREYIAGGNYREAREWIDQQTVRNIKQMLLEEFLVICGDSTFVKDLEAALIARADLVEGGATEAEFVEAELAILQKYQNMPFYDEALRQLVVEYLDALRMQEGALYYDQNSADYYAYFYYWNKGAARRYIVLDTLAAEFGFASEDSRIQALMGKGEGMLQWIEAWDEIHDLLSGSLWNVSAYWDGSRYCLDVSNHTPYTFGFTVYQLFTASDGTVISEYYEAIEAIAPGQSVQLTVAFPEGDFDYWFIDWDIYDIYQDGEFLG